MKEGRLAIFWNILEYLEIWFVSKPSFFRYFRLRAKCKQSSDTRFRHTFLASLLALFLATLLATVRHALPEPWIAGILFARKRPMCGKPQTTNLTSTLFMRLSQNKSQKLKTRLQRKSQVFWEFPNRGKRTGRQPTCKDIRAAQGLSFSLFWGYKNSLSDLGATVGRSECTFRALYGGTAKITSKDSALAGLPSHAHILNTIDSACVAWDTGLKDTSTIPDVMANRRWACVVFSLVGHWRSETEPMSVAFIADVILP